MTKQLLILFCLFFSFGLSAQDRLAGYKFIENKGQWNNKVQYKADIECGNLYLQKDGFVFDLYDGKEFQKYIKAHYQKDIYYKLDSLKRHAYAVNFIDANLDNKIIASSKTPEYYNYFLGRDKSKWASKAYGFHKIHYQNVYDNIDLKLYSKFFNLKYDFIVKPGGDASQIKLNYSGQDNLFIKNGKLVVKTTVNTIIEDKPFAYQIVEGKKIEVACNYVLTDNNLSFEFPNGFNSSLELIIDPTLIFSTYSGSFANNFGYTATFDSKGFLYAGSSVFGNTGIYPSTLGAYNTAFNGGVVDVGVSKYDTTGTFMVWSTYLGGNNDELPHSFIVNGNDELFILGTTSSPNFPVTTNAYDTTFAGGTAFAPTGLGVSYSNGSDIFVSRLAQDGSSLIGSTMIGGSENDGLNWTNSTCSLNTLRYNYADEIRGEIDIDENNNVYVVSSTRSNDFPTTSGCFQENYGGGPIDGCIFKLDNGLKNLIWSSYLGGSEHDAAYSLSIDSKNDIYITGGTNSTDLVTDTTVVHPTFNGGRSDGFVYHITKDGSSILNSSYYGSNAYDQIYFIELDRFDNVYLFGQTEASGSTFITNATYGTPNSGQLLSKLTPVLDSVIYSTTFGTPINGPNISPTAFLVDLCNKIYLSGWGGGTNQIGSLCNNAGFTTGMDVTTDAYQGTTDGSDFYIMVLEDDASALSYATFMGGNQAQEHVDGGTSRFDRKGKVYQSACAGCFYGTNPGYSDFPIEPANAVSPTNNSNCNNAVFKMDFNLPVVLADFETPPIGCAPHTYTFQNQSISQLATTYEWDFGDGSPISTSGNPTHTYSDPGTYDISLILTDNNTCNFGDTITKTILILGDTTYNLTPANICPGDIDQIGLLPNPDTSIHYNWEANSTLSDTAVSNPFASPNSTTTYLLLISNGVCVDSAYQTVNVNTPIIDAGTDTTVCLESANITVNANSFGTSSTYIWSTSNTFNDTLNSNIANSQFGIAPTSTSTYYVQGNNMGCLIYDSVIVTASFVQTSQVSSDSICIGETVSISATNSNPTDALTYDWSLDANIISGDGTATITSAPTVSTWYFVSAENAIGCTKIDSTLIEVFNDTTFSLVPLEMCHGDQLEIGFESQPHPDTTYLWNNASTLSNSFISNPLASPLSNTNYQLLLNNGVCVDTINQSVSVITPAVTASLDTVICDNSPPITISAFSPTSSNYIWSSTNNFQDTLNTDLTDPNLSVLPTAPTYYYVGVYFNGCFKYDSALVNLASSTISINGNDHICFGDTIQISASNLNPSDPVTYDWENDLDILSGDATSAITVAPQIDTWFYLEANSQAGCIVFDSIFIEVSQLPTETISVSAEFDTIVLGSSTQLSALPSGYDYTWTPPLGLNNPSIYNPLASPITTTTYSVTISDGPCTRSGSVTISVIELICGKPDVFVPNAFTPDANGKNDKVYVRGKNIKEMVFRIFDRWGELVFETTNQNEGWDGFYKGKPADPAVFVYYLDAICFDNQEYFEKGNITVIR